MSMIPGQRLSFTCEYCGVEFTELESHIRLGRKNGRFHSLECYQAARIPEQRCGACGTPCATCAQQKRQTVRAARAAREVGPGQAVCRACGVVFSARYQNHGRERRFCSDCWANRGAYAYRQRHTPSADRDRRNQRIIELRDAGKSASEIVDLLKTEWPKLGSQTVYKVVRLARDRRGGSGTS